MQHQHVELSTLLKHSDKLNLSETDQVEEKSRQIVKILVAERCQKLGIDLDEQDDTFLEVLAGRILFFSDLRDYINKFPQVQQEGVFTSNKLEEFAHKLTTVGFFSKVMSRENGLSTVHYCMFLHKWKNFLQKKVAFLHELSHMADAMLY